MQVVILAAGMGSRLGKYTKNNTKCMLEINGRTLIERALDALDTAGIRKCVIVVGYKKENLMAFVGSRYKNIDIAYIANDVYHKTNNIYSLYLARDYLVTDDTLLLESDLIFEERIIRELIANEEPTLAVVAPWEAWMDGTVVQISKDRSITNFIPRKYFNYNEKKSYYKTVNIYKFSRNFLEKSYVPFLTAYSHAMDNNEYYEDVLRVITTLEKNELKAMVLGEHKWYEIDDAQDKDIAELLFCDNVGERLSRIHRRFGGYWRFPNMLDFCYLVNPYFPTEQMRNEMKACFDELLTEYPSGLNVQNLLAAKLYNVEETNILACNGAAELIRALGNAISGTVGVIYPTFNESPENLECSLSIVPLYAENMTYTIDDLFRRTETCDNLVLINPDNPSGDYIKSADVLALAGTRGKKNKTLILAESFIDFCDAEENASLLTQETLESHPNMVIIKSLSKSYGVPGVRLGVAASSGKDIINAMRMQLPIWNINSFGEYFLQIIGKYAKNYHKDCAFIAGERKHFAEELERTELLDVHPSQANYFLCKIRGKMSAAELAKRLLESKNIFIKDLTGKRGIPGASWVRLAIRNRENNDRLVAALREIAADLQIPSPPPPRITHRIRISALPYFRERNVFAKEAA
jgi:histidinol-phosphate/aromatic aminotransferase/cobyric acid decarboxylase-like protein/choline kinase